MNLTLPLKWHLANFNRPLKCRPRRRGEQINTVKLTETEVREIRRVGYPLKQHAKKHGVSEALISSILKRKTWKHVK